MTHAKWMLTAFLVLGVTACGGSDSTASATTAPGEVASEATEGEATTTQAPEPTTTTSTLPPIDETNLQDRLLDAQPGDVIEIPAGTYSFERSLSLTVDGVTIRGAGIDDTILNFAGQVAGAEGLLVTASDFTIEDLAIEDSAGDALKINEGENIVIRRVRTEWTGGYATDNGAYGFYPVQTKNVLIEDSVAIGASDAGIYVGQSNEIIVRNNRVEFNVAGIEIENSVNADVYGNVVTNNTGGILIFNLSGLSQQGGDTRVYDNDVFANNTENFGPDGTIVSVVPSGSGILVMANDRVEIFDNRIEDNRSANVIVASAFVVGLDGGGEDPTFDGYPESIYIHDNEYSGGGDDPDAIMSVLNAIVNPEGGPLPAVVFDGFVDSAKFVDGVVAPENKICVQEDGADVLNADGSNDFAGAKIDNEAHDCTHEPLTPVDLSDLS